MDADVLLTLHTRLAWTVRILLVALAIGMSLRGARSWIRWGLLLLVLCWVGDVAVTDGGSAAAQRVAFIATVFCGSMLYATRRWKTPLRTQTEPLPVLEWPSHAAEEAERFSRDFAAIGFVQRENMRSRWGYGSEVRYQLSRVFIYPPSSTFVTVTAMERPKVLARAITSRLEDGSFVITSDRQTDFAALAVPFIRTAQVSQLLPVRELVHKHQTLTNGTAVAVSTDPRDLANEIRTRWIDRLMADGRARQDGEWISLTWKGSFLSMARIIRGFLR